VTNTLVTILNLHLAPVDIAACHSHSVTFQTTLRKTYSTFHPLLPVAPVPLVHNSIIARLMWWYNLFMWLSAPLDFDLYKGGDHNLMCCALCTHTHTHTHTHTCFVTLLLFCYNMYNASQYKIQLLYACKV
jgi:hypothetical protein